VAPKLWQLGISFSHDLKVVAIKREATQFCNTVVI